MPEVVPVLERHHDLALGTLAEWLENAVLAERLTDQTLRSTYPNRAFAAGWRVPTDFSGKIREFDLLIDRQFPFSQPRIGLGGPLQFLIWPHVEEDGILCLPARKSAHDTVEQAKTALSDGYELVSLNLTSPPRQHFQDEFLSYWARDVGQNSSPTTSLLEVRGPARRIVVWHGKVWNILAENENALQRWFQNRFGRAQKPPDTEAAALIWLPHPLCPDEFPKTTSDVWALGRDVPDGKSVLRELAANSPRRIVVVLGAESRNGPCLAAVTVSPLPLGLGGKKRNVLQKGFRPGRVPPEIASARFWNTGSQVARSKVTRADAAWVHGRDRDSKQHKLGGAKVILVGAGSVGAPVASQLAMAGVGHLVIIDPEKLTAANTGRHPLGAKHIDRYKAEALAQELCENYPHDEIGFRNDTWQDVNAKEPGLFADASLIISATGDWNMDDAMNTWHVERGKTPPILYGWTEEHACAGQAVLITSGEGACLACGLSPDGSPKFRVTKWPGSMLKQEPGCGSLYQPYGPVELSHTVNLISELALDVLVIDEVESTHHIWACRLRFLEACGGQWTEKWLADADHRIEGGNESHREWPRDPACRVCGVHG